MLNFSHAEIIIKPTNSLHFYIILTSKENSQPPRQIPNNIPGLQTLPIFSQVPHPGEPCVHRDIYDRHEKWFQIHTVPKDRDNDQKEARNVAFYQCISYM